MASLTELAPCVLVELSFACGDVQLLEQLDGLVMADPVDYLCGLTRGR